MYRNELLNADDARLEIRYKIRKSSAVKVLGISALEPGTKEKLEDKTKARPEADYVSRRTLLLFILILATSAYYWFGPKEDKNVIKGLQAQKVKPDDVETVVSDPVIDALDDTEWDINITPSEGEVFPDILTFHNKKVSSATFSLKGFRFTSYSAVQKKDKILWETVQTFSGKTLSWRGEVKDEKMQGIVSLHSGKGI